jgi:eukaryotic-like serine/threonine-protein kinase
VLGETLGSYRVIGKIGTGGMGVVYLAEHPLIGRKAAVKLLLPELSKSSEIVNRFFNEARMTALIRHPGLIDIFDFGYHASGAAFLVMEYLQGETLGKRLKRERALAPPLVAMLVRQIAGAVGAAHARGIVHRDLKPDNLYLVPEKGAPGGIRVKVLDFGIAKLSAAAAGKEALKTKTGNLLGTPMYMSPEQCRKSATVDKRSDIYALGCIAFEMLCGRTVFAADGVGDVIACHILEPPPLARSIDEAVPAELDELVQRMLAKKPEDRPQSMEEVEAALDAIAKQLDWNLTETASVSGPIPAVAEDAAMVASADTEEAPSGEPDRPRSPSTLSASAAEISGAKGPRRRGFVLGAAAVLTLAVGLAVVVMRRETAPPTAAPPAPVPAPPPRSPPPAPATVTFAIESEPSGAEVVRLLDGARLGHTPLTLTAEAAPGEVAFLVRHEGYDDRTVTLPAARGGRAVATLVSQAPPARAAAPPPPPPARPARTGSKPVYRKGETVDPFNAK